MLYFNWPLYRKFGPILAQQVSYNTPDKLDDLIRFVGLPNNVSYIATVSAPGTMTATATIYTMLQQAQSLGAMCDLDSLFFTTNAMPIIPQLQPPPVGANTNNFQLKVLTDFIPPLQNAIDASPQSALRYDYQQEGPYRYIDMIQGQELRTIDWQIYYKTRNGDIRPLWLSPGTNASVLLMFEKKLPEELERRKLKYHGGK